MRNGHDKADHVLVCFDTAFYYQDLGKANRKGTSNRGRWASASHALIFRAAVSSRCCDVIRWFHVYWMYCIIGVIKLSNSTSRYSCVTINCLTARSILTAMNPKLNVIKPT